MLTSSRTYRLMAALMAVLLLVGGSLPLVQHVCAMAIGPGQTDKHPCSRDNHGKTTAHQGMHGLMPAHSQAELPCPHKTQLQASPGDCCAVEATPAITTNGVRLLKRSLRPVTTLIVAVPAEALSHPNSPPFHALFFDTGPPPASVSLHLLHAVLLN